MMLGLQSTIWQQFRKALIQKLNPVSMDVHVITNGAADHRHELPERRGSHGPVDFA